MANMPISDWIWSGDEFELNRKDMFQQTDKINRQVNLFCELYLKK